jgi:hypothetical protein
MDVIGDSTLTTLQTPASITADGNTAGIDARNLIGHGAIVMTALKIAGTNPTLAVKLQGTADADVVTSVTPGSNTGNGTCTQVYGGPDAIAETITVTIGADTGTFAVSGGTTGAMAAGVVGTLYQTAQVEFMVTAGSVGFAQNDSFAIVTTARTYADVSGGGFTGLTTSPSIQKKALNFEALPRYLRVNYDIGGTNTPEYVVSVFAQSGTN